MLKRVLPAITLLILASAAAYAQTGAAQIQGVAADKGATRIVVVGSSVMFANAPLGAAANADFATLSLNWLLNRDVFLADKAWFYVTLLTIGYMISRGLAKAGSRARRDA